jgi:radical SAM superfamily enzyme
VKQREYTDKSFLQSALQAQDVVVILLGFAGLPYQDAVIEAAATVGVEYILPAEYGLDSANNKILNAVEVIQDKKDIQQKIEALGVKWIAVVTGPWIEYVRNCFLSVLLHITTIDI